MSKTRAKFHAPKCSLNIPDKSAFNIDEWNKEADRNRLGRSLQASPNIGFFGSLMAICRGRAKRLAKNP